MIDREAELEKQVAELTTKVARLRRLVIAGFIGLGILLALGLNTSPVMISMLVIGFMVWGIVYIGATLASAWSRRSQRKRGSHVM
ncbi:MAG TPA: hypothetical protein VGO57_05370 [Verrucomicrobiae bacterium]|jgi:hypothetical protein